MPKLNRRDFMKILGVSVPIVGLGAYELTSDTNAASNLLNPPISANGKPAAPAAPAAAPAAPAAAPAASARRSMNPYLERSLRLSNSNSSASANAGPLPETGDIIASQPARIESVNGVLEMELRAEYQNPVVGGKTLKIRNYTSPQNPNQNQSLPGPTLVAHPGDVLRITHVNNMPFDAEVLQHPHDINHHHGYNVINLHTHGLNVNPEGNEDNILVSILPGETFVYEIYIPDDHPTGTFWYHPHKHGASALHLASGMAGFLLITKGDSSSPALEDIPEIAAAKDVTIMLQELMLQGDLTVPNWPETGFLEGMTSMQLTINGLASNGAPAFGSDPPEVRTDLVTGIEPGVPVLRMKPGEVQRWRFSEAGFLNTYKFGLQGHEMHIVAYDGITPDNIHTVPAVTVAQGDINTETPGIVMASGNRYDFMVKASATPGTYAFYSMPYAGVGRDSQGQPAVLFNVVVEGEAMDMSLPTSLAAASPLARLPYILDSEIVKNWQVDFKVTGSMGPPDTRQFWINNKKFTGQVDHTMVLDTAEEWLITNDNMQDHPFHIHTNWIQVTKLTYHDGREEILNPPRWQDTINIPWGGSATIRHRFEKFHGKYVFHCHILTHEDEGMMALMEVVPGTPVSSPVTAAGGGVLLSNDYERNVMVEFFAGAVSADTTATYQYLRPDDEIASKPIGDLLHVDRVFKVEAGAPLQKAAQIQVKYPTQNAEIRHTIYLYRWNGTEWSHVGISKLSNAVAGATSHLLCTVKELGTFAVLRAKNMRAFPIANHFGTTP